MNENMTLEQRLIELNRLSASAITEDMDLQRSDPVNDLKDTTDTGVDKLPEPMRAIIAIPMYLIPITEHDVALVQSALAFVDQYRLIFKEQNLILTNESVKIFPVVDNRSRLVGSLDLNKAASVVMKIFQQQMKTPAKGISIKYRPPAETQQLLYKMIYTDLVGNPASRVINRTDINQMRMMARRLLKDEKLNCGWILLHTGDRVFNSSAQPIIDNTVVEFFNDKQETTIQTETMDSTATIGYKHQEVIQSAGDVYSKEMNRVYTRPAGLHISPGKIFTPEQQKIFYRRLSVIQKLTNSAKHPLARFDKEPKAIASMADIIGDESAFELFTMAIGFNIDRNKEEMRYLYEECKRQVRTISRIQTETNLEK